MVDDNPWRFPPGKFPPAEYLEFMPNRSGAPMGGAPRAMKPLLPKKAQEEMRGEFNKLINESRQAPAKPPQKQETVIPPSSPKVQQAVDRLMAWLPINERNGPNPAIRTNIVILQRGGPMAEKMAEHILNTWKEPPWLKLEAPAIDIKPGEVE
jgi:hypothetical protein